MFFSISRKKLIFLFLIIREKSEGIDFRPYFNFNDSLIYLCCHHHHHQIKKRRCVVKKSGVIDLISGFLLKFYGREIIFIA